MGRGRVAGLAKAFVSVEAALTSEALVVSQEVVSNTGSAVGLRESTAGARNETVLTSTLRRGLDTGTGLTLLIDELVAREASEADTRVGWGARGTG